MLVNNGTIASGGKHRHGQRAGWNNTGEIEMNGGSLVLSDGMNSGTIDVTEGACLCDVGFVVPDEFFSRLV